jgi:hypothetical protein
VSTVSIFSPSSCTLCKTYHYDLAGGGAIAYPRTNFWRLRIAVADGILPLDRNLETAAGGRLKVASSCKLAAAQPLHEHGLQFRVQNVINDGKE